MFDCSSICFVDVSPKYFELARALKMNELNKSISQINESSVLNDIISGSNFITSKCDGQGSFSSHLDCFDYTGNELLKPQCQYALTFALVKILATNPKLIDDSIKSSVVGYFKLHEVKAKGFLSQEILSVLSETQSPLLTWLKYESLLCQLIKEKIYEPKAVANEVLETVKNDLPQEVAIKFSSVLDSCVKHCREAGGGQSDEEEKGKWCEIIDWMSWFLVDQDDESF